MYLSFCLFFILIFILEFDFQFFLFHFFSFSSHLFVLFHFLFFKSTPSFSSWFVFSLSEIWIFRSVTGEKSSSIYPEDHFVALLQYFTSYYCHCSVVLIYKFVHYYLHHPEYVQHNLLGRLNTISVRQIYSCNWY